MDRQHSEDVPIEIEALVVRQDDLVTLKRSGVAQSASMKVNDMEGVVFQRRPRIWSHRFVVTIHLVDKRGPD